MEHFFSTQLGFLGTGRHEKSPSVTLWGYFLDIWRAEALRPRNRSPAQPAFQPPYRRGWDEPQALGGYKRGPTGTNLENSMDKHLIASRLDQLQSDGQTIAMAITKPESITFWYASAIDTLTLFLPEASELVRVFKELRDRQSHGCDERLLPQALDVLRIAADVNRLRRSDDLVADLRRDVQTSVGEIYRKSGWFYFPVTVLFLAAGFAVVGVIELRGTRINVREEAEAALRAAKASIEEHRTNVERSIDAIGKQAQSKADEAKQDVERKLELQLQSSVEEARGRINTAAQKHLETIKREKTPNLEFGLIAAQAQLAGVEKRLQQVQGQLATLQSSLDELERALKRVDRAVAAGTLDRLSLFLNRSRRYVWAELLVNSAALLILIAALITRVVRRFHG